MLGFTAEYDVQQLLPAGSGVGSGSVLSGSAVDASKYLGGAQLRFAAGSGGGSVVSILPTMQYCTGASVSTAASADASGTWVDWTTQPFTAVNLGSPVSMVTALADIKAVEGKYIRMRLPNNQTDGTLVATGVLIARKQDN